MLIQPIENRKNWTARVVLPESMLTLALERVYDGKGGSLYPLRNQKAKTYVQANVNGWIYRSGCQTVSNQIRT